MAVLRWDPWGELAALQRDVNSLLDRAPGTPSRQTGAFVPLIDAFRTDAGLVVRVELPGLRPEEVDVSVQEGVLTISGERPLEADVKEDGWLRRERPVGAFERSFTMPEGTRAEEISASFEHGVLELRIPHPPEQQPRRIHITSSDSDTVEVGSG